MPSQNTTFDNNLVGPLNEQSKSFLNNIQIVLNDQMDTDGDLNEVNIEEERREFEVVKNQRDAKSSGEFKGKLAKSNMLGSPKYSRLKSADRERKVQGREKLHYQAKNSRKEVYE